MNSFVFPEIMAAGIFDSAIVFKGLSKSQIRHLERYELEIPIENGGISHIDDVSRPITTNLIVCAKPGQTRYTLLPLRCHYIHILAAPGPICEYLSALPDFIETENPQKYLKLFSDISLAYSLSGESSDIYIASKVLYLIHSLYQDQHKSQKAMPTDNPLLLEALSYMDNHYLDNISLADVARKINISQVHFHRLFADALGKTPYQYLLEKRLEEARKMLLTTNHSLTEIAIATGFSSQSHFGLVFKKTTGKTPLQYRTEMLMNYFD